MSSPTVSDRFWRRHADEVLRLSARQYPAPRTEDERAEKIQRGRHLRRLARVGRVVRRTKPGKRFWRWWTGGNGKPERVRW